MAVSSTLDIVSYRRKEQRVICGASLDLGPIRLSDSGRTLVYGRIRTSRTRNHFKKRYDRSKPLKDRAAQKFMLDNARTPRLPI